MATSEGGRDVCISLLGTGPDASQLHDNPAGKNDCEREKRVKFFLINKYLIFIIKNCKNIIGFKIKKYDIIC